ncbi:MAG TPA: LLM class flavin-dependent oxidoreductase [Acidimicrobiia bacterium]|nr:LLM class flavin-dependent oxidoreductase [Acidimicrobiia bacterium]
MTRLPTIGLLAPGLPAASMAVRARECEAAGYSGLWAASHFMGWVPEGLWSRHLPPTAGGPHDALEPAAHLAAVAMVTDRVRLGTVVVDPLTRHPALLAQSFLTLHHLSGGRAVLGIGAGEATNTLPYGIDATNMASRFEEAVEVIRALWAGGEASYRGRFFALDRAVLGLVPSDGTLPPIWTGAHGPRLLRATGRLADGWIPGPLPPDDYQARLTVIRAAAAAAGRDPAAIEPALFTYVAIAEDSAVADAALAHPLVRSLALPLPAEHFARHGTDHPLVRHGMSDLIPNRFTPAEIDAAVAAVPDSLLDEVVLHGTPDDVRRQLGVYAEAGCRDVVMVNVTPLGAPAAGRSSRRLLDELVSTTLTEVYQ